MSPGPRVSWKLCTSCPEKSSRKMGDWSPLKITLNPQAFWHHLNPDHYVGPPGKLLDTYCCYLRDGRRWAQASFYNLLIGLVVLGGGRSWGGSWHRTGCSRGAEVRAGLGGLAREGAPQNPGRSLKDKVRSPPYSWEILSLEGGLLQRSPRQRWGRGARPHHPLVGVPGDKPPSEGGRLMALLDQNDGCVQAPLCWVSPQVLPAPGHCLLPLITCFFPKPQEDLGHRESLGWDRRRNPLTRSPPPDSMLPGSLKTLRAYAWPRALAQQVEMLPRCEHLPSQACKHASNI